MTRIEHPHPGLALLRFPRPMHARFDPGDWKRMQRHRRTRRRNLMAGRNWYSFPAESRSDAVSKRWFRQRILKAV